MLAISKKDIGDLTDNVLSRQIRLRPGCSAVGRPVYAHGEPMLLQRIVFPCSDHSLIRIEEECTCTARTGELKHFRPLRGRNVRPSHADDHTQDECYSLHWRTMVIGTVWPFNRTIYEPTASDDTSNSFPIPWNTSLPSRSKIAILARSVVWSIADAGFGKICTG